MAVKPIPDGYRSVTPYLIVNGADKLLDFLKKAFAAEERVRMPMDDGSIGHAEVMIGDSVVMMGESSDEWAATSAMIHLYVEDCDSTYRQAVEAGAVSLGEPTDRFYGDRMAEVRDPAGNTWSIATHVEDVPEEEMARRAKEAAAPQ
jgi:PhnB protein